MKLRTRYLLVGLAWALWLAPMVTYVVLGAVAGVLWLFVFGDNPWPRFADVFIPALGLVMLVSTAAGCMYAGYAHGRAMENKPGLDPAREWRRAWVWALVPQVLLAVSVAVFWQRSSHRSDIAASDGRLEAQFASLLNTRHTLNPPALQWKGRLEVAATLTTSGGRPGPYVIGWNVQDKVYRRILAHGTDRLTLGSDAAMHRLDLSVHELAHRYRDTVLHGGGVLVEEPFELVVTLAPHVTEADMQAWPADERDRWQRGESPLRSRVGVAFPVHFIVRQDGVIDFPQR